MTKLRVVSATFPRLLRCLSLGGVISAFLAAPASAIVVLNNAGLTSQQVGYNQSVDGVNLSGVVSIVSAGVGGCTGSLLADGVSILTAGHCVSASATGYISSNMTVYFQGPSGAITYQATSVTVNPGWDGNPTDGGDLAVIHLGALAPAFATRYQLNMEPAVFGAADVIAGYGYTGTGTTGYSSSSGGTLLAGENALEEAGNTFYSPWSANSLIGQFYDASHPYTNALGVANPFSATDEVNIAPGDSGGPAFQNGELVAVNDFITCLGSTSCDTPPSESSALNSSFGELFGETSVYGNLSFIETAMAPEPGTISLMLGALLASLLLRMRRSEPEPAKVSLRQTRTPSRRRRA